MFIKDLQLAFRHLARNKTFTFINILGLATGIACCSIIILYLLNELEYDSSYPDVQRIYRVAEHRIVPAGEFRTAASCAPLGPALKKDYAEVEEVGRLFYLPNPLVQIGIDNFFEKRAAFADTGFFNLFDINFLVGSQEKVFAEKHSLALTREVSEKYFGKENPVGKSIKLKLSSHNQGDREYDFTVRGIVENPPMNTHLKFGILIPLQELSRHYFWYESEWHAGGTYTYIKLREDADPVASEKKLSNVANNYVGEEFAKWGQKRSYFLQPLTSIHMHSSLQDETEPPGNWLYIYVYAIIALLILSIGCLNYINLSTVRSTTRMKEVGLRKVVGAARFQLTKQFLGESFLVTFFSFLLGVLFLELMLPYFNQLTQLDLSFSALARPKALAAIAVLFILVSFGAGGYPAIILTSVKPVSTLTGRLGRSLAGSFILRVLVVAQFVITIVLLICSLTVADQLTFMQGKTLGFDIQNKIILPFTGNLHHFRKNYEMVKEEFLKISGIKGATASSSIPGNRPGRTFVRVPGDGHSWPVPGYANPEKYNFYSIDDAFLDLYKVQILAGRTYNPGSTFDEKNSFIVNKAAAQKLGFNDPEQALGYTMRESFYGREKKIVAVVDDFHYRGMQHKIAPLIMEWSTSRFAYLTLQVDPGSFDSAIQAVRQTWEALYPDVPFIYHFLDSRFSKEYSYESQVTRLLGSVTAIGLITSCLGLLGLASFVAQRRKREIGIRKVLGAGTARIVSMLSRQYALLVLIAGAVAVPVAYTAMQKWLENFAYRIDQQWYLAAAAIVLTLLLATGTVTIEGIKAAIVNPVDSIRDE